MVEQKRFDVVCVGTAAWDVLLTGIDRNMMNLDGQHLTGYFASSGGAAVNAAIKEKLKFYFKLFHTGQE